MRIFIHRSNIKPQYSLGPGAIPPWLYWRTYCNGDLLQPDIYHLSILWHFLCPSHSLAPTLPALLYQSRGSRTAWACWCRYVMVLLSGRALWTFYLVPKAKLHPNGGHGNSSDVSLHVYLVVYYYCSDTFTRYSGRELV